MMKRIWRCLSMLNDHTHFRLKNHFSDNLVEIGYAINFSGIRKGCASDGE